MNSKSKHIGVIMKINSCCSFDSEQTQKRKRFPPLFSVGRTMPNLHKQQFHAQIQGKFWQLLSSTYVLQKKKNSKVLNHIICFF
jgi:hypothetical protein